VAHVKYFFLLRYFLFFFLPIFFPFCFVIFFSFKKIVSRSLNKAAFLLIETQKSPEFRQICQTKNKPVQNWSNPPEIGNPPEIKNSRQTTFKSARIVQIWWRKPPSGNAVLHCHSMGGLVISRAACRAISARRRTTAHITSTHYCCQLSFMY
jgi:hypothetical protein